MRVDDDDEGWAQEIEEQRRRNYRFELMAHPDPRDPDHPEPIDVEDEA